MITRKGWGVLFTNEVETWLTCWVSDTKKGIQEEVKDIFGSMKQACVECNAVRGRYVRVTISLTGEMK